MMRGRAAKQGLGLRMGTAAVLVSGLALAGCANVDDALFGPAPPTTPAQGEANAGAPPEQQAAVTPPAAAPSTAPSSAGQTEAPGQAAPVQAAPPPAMQAEAAPPPAAASSSMGQSEVGGQVEAAPSGQTQMAAEAPPPQHEPRSWFERLLFGSDEDEDNGNPPPPAGAETEVNTSGPAQATQFGAISISPSVPAISPIAISNGVDTGTTVNKSIQTMRGQAADLEQKVLTNASKVADIRNGVARAATTYETATAQIVARLQLGTTRGNPELVNTWNTAQAALDQLSGNINAMASLANAVGSDASATRMLTRQIFITFDMPGAVDEDHRQLSVLQDEAGGVLTSTDRLYKIVTGDVRRQTAFVGSERANLANLANSIKNGDPYGTTNGRMPMTSSLPMATSVAYATTDKPLVVIRFNRPDVAYQQILLSALNQALKVRPDASFKVVAVTPPQASAEAVASAQSAARRHAQDVLQAMTGMGVPAGRLQVASWTDPKASGSEVRVFVI